MRFTGDCRFRQFAFSELIGGAECPIISLASHRISEQRLPSPPLLSSGAVPRTVCFAPHGGRLVWVDSIRIMVGHWHSAAGAGAAAEARKRSNLPMDGHPAGAIWPVGDSDSAQFREVYARYGLAMSQAQVLEHGLVNAVLVFKLMPTMRDHSNEAAWMAAFDRFYEVELGRTFGNMLKAVATIPGFPEPLLGRLQEAKRDRDELAHRFFREADTDIMTREGRTRMIASCERTIETFTELDREVEAFCAEQRKRFGITDEWVRTKVDEMFAEATAAARSRQE
jgi:hypothetical protein